MTNKYRETDIEESARTGKRKKKLTKQNREKKLCARWMHYQLIHKPAASSQKKNPRTLTQKSSTYTTKDRATSQAHDHTKQRKQRKQSSKHREQHKIRCQVRPFFSPTSYLIPKIKPHQHIPHSLLLYKPRTRCPCHANSYPVNPNPLPSGSGVRQRRW